MPARILPAPQPLGPTVYLGISGVLHPSESLYSLVHGASPWARGHSRYEGVPILAKALEHWPDVRIVLTSALPRTHDLKQIVDCLGPSLAVRLSGWTFEDITTKVKREVATRNGTTRTVGYASNDYWRMNKADIVATHVAWSRPLSWVAIDDEDILWPVDVRRERLVIPDPCAGLVPESTQERLMTVLQQNFGGLTRAMKTRCSTSSHR